MPSGNYARVQDQNVLAIVGGIGAPARVQAQDVLVIGGQAAKRLRVQQQDVIGVGTDEGFMTVLRVEAQNIIVIAGVDEVPTFPYKVSAFDFSLDGHFYYGIHIQDQGTFVYDQTTQQWAQWNSGSLLYWDVQFMQDWGDFTYASTLIDNSIVQIDPDSVLDDSFRVNTFQATGRVESQSRRWVQNPEAQLFGSIGLRGGDVTLRMSDNEGETFMPDMTIEMTEGVRDANVVFYNLGSVRAPGRLYQIEDEGALRRIQSLKIILGSGDEDGNS